MSLFLLWYFLRWHFWYCASLIYVLKRVESRSDVDPVNRARYITTAPGELLRQRRKPDNRAHAASCYYQSTRGVLHHITSHFVVISSQHSVAVAAKYTQLRHTRTLYNMTPFDYTIGKPPSTDRKPLPHMERWYFCDHLAAFQSFPLHLTMATNFLCPLQWNSVWTDSIWIVVFQPWKTPSHWLQTPSIHGKSDFLWLPDSLF